MNIYFTVLKKFSKFSGLSRMSEYWVFTFMNFIFTVFAILLDNLIGTTLPPLPFGVISIVYSLVVILPGNAVFVRRMHETGKSGWYILLSFIPIIGAVWLWALCITEGTKGVNEYGTDPKAVSLIQS